MAKVHFKYRPPPGILPPGVRDSEPPPEAIEAGPEAPAKVDRWWYESSWDLRHGLEVSDQLEDTVPAELLDELFKEPAPASPRKK